MDALKEHVVSPDRRARMLEAINRVQAEFIRQADSDCAFGLLLDELIDLTKSEGGIIGQLNVVDDGAAEVAIAAYSDNLSERYIRDRYGSASPMEWSSEHKDPFLAELIKTRGAVVRNHMDRDNTVVPDVHSVACLPLVAGDRLVGAVSLVNRAPGYSERLVADLQPVLGTAADLIEACQAIQQRASTKRELSEDALLRRSIMDTSLEAIISANCDGEVIDFNPAAELIFGYRKDEVLGLNVGKTFFPRARQESARTRFNAYQKTGQTKWMGHRFESQAKRSDGSLFPIELAISEVEVHGRPVYISFIRDITAQQESIDDLRAAKEAAEAANKAKTRFVATVSHEIRTPLNAISGGLGLLEHSTLTHNERDYLRVAKDSARVLTELIDDVLDFSKIEAGNEELEQLELFPIELLDGVIRMLAQRAQSRTVSIASIVDPQVPYRVIGDAGRLRQLLVNLVGNAIKFSPGGNIIVEVTSLADNMLRFAIQDDGIGIPAGQEDRIFGEFEQVRSGGDSEMGGTGLGLAICKRIVAMLGGEIGCNSRVGEGSLFWFTLPYMPVEGSGLQPGGSSEFSHLRIALVSAVQPWKNILVRQLQAWNIRIDLCESTRELRGRSFDKHDLIFVDGEALCDAQCAELLSEYQGSGGKVVVLRAESSAEVNGLRPDFTIDAHIFQEQLWRCCALCLDRWPEEWEESRWAFRGAEPHFPSSPRLLLVEDSHATRMIGVAILSRYGLKVDAVADGIEAVAAVESLPYDLVLMDVDMPGMDGIAATAEIRALSGPRSQVPIIGISAHALEIMRDRCLQAGMNDYLTKPMDRRVLLECLARYFAVESNPADDVTHSNSASPDARIDLHTLRELARETSPDSIGRMIRIFIDELHDRVQVMRAALRCDDAKSLGAESHALKSSAATFGFVAVATLATKIDEAVRRGDLKNAAVLFSELEAEVAPSIDAVRNELGPVRSVA